MTKQIQNQKPTILAIETSCDETCASVTRGAEVLSNVVWSQVELHKEFGGVVPSIARRAHEEKIGFVVDKAMSNARCQMTKIDAVAVTAGPGLAIALEVGVRKAKELAKQYNKPLIAVNHIEGHVLSPLAEDSKAKGKRQKAKVDLLKFPAMGMVVSGGHTELVLIKAIGDYEIVARKIDDALGESLDKAARLLGLGYPGGAELEKKARGGDPKAYPLPLPMAGREDRGEFSYSGLKTAFYRLVNEIENRDRGTKGLTDEQVRNLAAGYQNRAFEHLLRITKKVLEKYPVHDLLVGGGVAINQELRKRVEVEIEKNGIRAWWPAKGLYGDNAAMVGVAAGFKLERGEIEKETEKVDREPRARVDRKFEWQS